VAATVERVLEAGPGVRVLATSRQPIGVPGERVWQTPPISFPDDADLRGPAELASFDAVRLFTERAGPLGTAGDVPLRDLRVIAEITAQLDGIPLAIELAAARAAQLDLDQLAAVLQDRLGLSWLESRTAHARQQTLAAAIGWSYDLLTPQLQSALKRLAVFSGGFTLEAAGAVTGAPRNITVTVAALAERSLIVADRSARPGRPEGAAVRYRMLETIRQYCAGRIADDDGPDGEQADRDAHGRFFAGLAQRASAALTGWQQGRWLTTLEADHANLVAAINHFLGRPSGADEALRMIVHLDRFWHNRGHLAECAILLRRALDAVDQDVGPAVRCGALNLAGQATVGYDVQAARAYFTASLDIARSARDYLDAARASWGLSFVGYYTGDVEGGSTAGKAAVDLARAMGDPVLLGECLAAYGLVCNPMERKAIYQEALAVTRRSGDRVYTGWSHNNLGDAFLSADDLDAAQQHLEEAEAILLHEVGHPNPLPLLNLGWVHLCHESTESAKAAFTEGLHRCERAYLRRDATVAILGLACTAAAEGEWDRAACLLGFADGELQNCGGSWADPERTYRQQSLTGVEGQLGAEFDRHYDSGRTDDRGDLIDFALRQQHIS
jgi:predicted ATPase